MRTPDHWKKFSLRTLPLLPLSLLYRIGNWVDRETTKPIAADLPVISIGNVTAGGTGKTPVALALAPLLADLGFTPHFITRGYKSAKPLNAHRVTDADTATTVGDEALLLSRIAPTWVGRDRIASIKAAKRNGANLAICDDAHQHYRLKKDLSFLVIDGPYGFGNGQLIPAGPLREPLHHALARTDAAIIIGKDVDMVAARIILPVFRADLIADTAQLDRTKSYFAFAGIGRPEKFYTTLRNAGITVVGTRDFADHHTYTEAELRDLSAEARHLGATLITTEKDAVKLPAPARGEIAVLPVTLQFSDPHGFYAFLRDRLT